MNKSRENIHPQAEMIALSHVYQTLKSAARERPDLVRQLTRSAKFIQRMQVDLVKQKKSREPLANYACIVATLIDRAYKLGKRDGKAAKRNAH